MFIGVKKCLGKGISGIEIFHFAQRIGKQDRIIKGHTRCREIFTCTLQSKACCLRHQFIELTTGYFVPAYQKIIIETHLH